MGKRNHYKASATQQGSIYATEKDSNAAVLNVTTLAASTARCRGGSFGVAASVSRSCISNCWRRKNNGRSNIATVNDNCAGDGGSVSIARILYRVGLYCLSHLALPDGLEASCSRPEAVIVT